jgi:hypothetical protein
LHIGVGWIFWNTHLQMRPLKLRGPLVRLGAIIFLQGDL